MDSLNSSQDIKAAKQAWRKKPRKFAPKSRLGCKTCKIRRIKCDLAQPSCNKCQSTGRKCDGYQVYHDNDNLIASFSSSVITQQTGWTVQQHPATLVCASLEPLLLLPMTDSIQELALSFFEHISIGNLNEYQPCPTWRQTVVYFSQTVPAVRDATTALALIHRSYLDTHDTMDMTLPKSSNPNSLKTKSLHYYNRAIQSLLKLNEETCPEGTAITLLVCYLFICYETLADSADAFKHLGAGAQLLRDIDSFPSKATGTPSFADAPHVIHQVAKQIRRLDLQTVIYITDWKSNSMHKALDYLITTSSLIPQHTFNSLEQASEVLEILIAQAMTLRNAQYQTLDTSPNEISPSAIAERDSILDNLRAWLASFNNMSSQKAIHQSSPNHQVVLLLKIQHLAARIFLGGYGPEKEMEYDQFLAEFTQCIALTETLMVARKQSQNHLHRTFTPEVGVVIVLYIVGAKCRDGLVRRKASSLLRQQPMREASWNSLVTARVVERIIQIEEAPYKQLLPRLNMETIEMRHRVDNLAMSRVENVQGADVVHITYTLCGQSQVRTESLLLQT